MTTKQPILMRVHDCRPAGLRILRRHLLIVMFALLALCGCASGSQQKSGTMEHFDIDYFSKHAVDNELSDTARDGTVTRRVHYADGYVERIVMPAGCFDTYKEFDREGRLRLSGQLFKLGGYKAGLWRQYATDGKQISVVDQDAPYRLKVAQVLELATRAGAGFDMSDAHLRVARAGKFAATGKAAWIVEWQDHPGRVERIVLDDESARVIKRDFYAFEDDR